jgi:hypothetical protein
MDDIEFILWKSSLLSVEVQNGEYILQPHFFTGKTLVSFPVGYLNNYLVKPLSGKGFW